MLRRMITQSQPEREIIRLTDSKQTWFGSSNFRDEAGSETIGTWMRKPPFPLGDANEPAHLCFGGVILI